MHIRLRSFRSDLLAASCGADARAALGRCSCDVGAAHPFFIPRESADAGVRASLSDFMRSDLRCCCIPGGVLCFMFWWLAWAKFWPLKSHFLTRAVQLKC